MLSNALVHSICNAEHNVPGCGWRERELFRTGTNWQRKGLTALSLTVQLGFHFQNSSSQPGQHRLTAHLAQHEQFQAAYVQIRHSLPEP